MFPVVLGCLPLREDFEENSTVFECFLKLYQGQHSILAQNLVPVLRLAALVYSTKQADESKFSCCSNIYLVGVTGEYFGNCSAWLAGN